MNPRAAITILILCSGIAPSYGQESGQELWRSILSAADRLKSDGRFDEAERAYRDALQEARRLEPNLAPSATTYHNLAGLYQDMARYDPAVQAYQRSIDLWRKVGAPGAKYLLQTANHLIGLYLEYGAVPDAERHYLALVAPRLAGCTGSERDPEVAEAFANLGSIHYGKRKYLEARTAYETALAIRERVSTEPSSAVAILLNNLAFALVETGSIEQALAYSQRSLAMVEATAGSSSPLLIFALTNGAKLLMAARHSEEAERLLDRALSIARSTVGEEQSITANVMSTYAALLKGTRRKKEAAVLESRVRQIRSSQSGPRQTVDVRELSRMK